MSINEPRLTGKQRRFVDEYVICLNGTEAARRAGYAGDDASLASQASHLLRNDKVLHAIDSALKQFAMPAYEVLGHLSDIGRGDIADTLSVGGRIDVLEAKRRGKSQNIKRIKEKVTTFTDKDGQEHETVETEIEMYDRQQALNTLAKFHALLIDRLKVVDWQDEVIALLRDEKITPEQVAEELGHELAQELFKRVGLPVASSGKDRPT